MDGAPAALALLTSPDWEDYQLLDSGNGQKLERYGPYTFVGPEGQAIWAPALQRERCFPSSVVGPVLLRALRRLAAIRGNSATIEGSCDFCAKRMAG